MLISPERKLQFEAERICSNARFNPPLLAVFQPMVEHLPQPPELPYAVEQNALQMERVPDYRLTMMDVLRATNPRLRDRLNLAAFNSNRAEKQHLVCLYFGLDDVDTTPSPCSVKLCLTTNVHGSHLAPWLLTCDDMLPQWRNLYLGNGITPPALLAWAREYGKHLRHVLWLSGLVDRAAKLADVRTAAVLAWCSRRYREANKLPERPFKAACQLNFVDRTMLEREVERAMVFKAHNKPDCPVYISNLGYGSAQWTA
jgi:hypothetical protein